MSCYKSVYQIDDQWNVLHLPNQPNGFAIMIIGDTHHYVNEDSNLWEESTSHHLLLQTLLQEGYTVFYSNLYGHHWGNLHSQKLAEDLIHNVLGRGILNRKIHLLAEGMGALTALNLMEYDHEKIRSCVLINPLLDLQKYLKSVKEMKWFYKRMLLEIARAYHVPVAEVENHISRKKPLADYKTNVSVKIWHSTERSVYPFTVHSRPYAKNREKLGSPITLMIHFPEHQLKHRKEICAFFKENEKQL